MIKFESEIPWQKNMSLIYALDPVEWVFSSFRIFGKISFVIFLIECIQCGQIAAADHHYISWIVNFWGGVLCSSLAAFHFSIRFSVKSTISFCTLSSYAVRPHFSLAHGPSKYHQIGCESIKFSFNIHSHLELSIHSKIWKHKKIEKPFISVEFWCLKGKNKTIFRLGAIFSGFRE